MHFNDYLIYYQKKNKIKSASSLFKILGGEKKLEIKLRNFLQIYSQERHPSLKVFLKILEQLPLEEYKSAIISFFSTAGNATKQSNKLLNYLEKNLTVAIDKKSPSIWDKVDSVRVLNDVQLKYLNSNPEALRFFNLLLLKENLSIKYFKSKEHILKKLEELELVKLKSNGTIERPYHGIRVPIPKISYENILKILSPYK
jgi:hypothetical protein